MRICFVVRALPVHRLGGLEHHIRDLTLGLAERGHEVDIVTTRGGGADELAKVGQFIRVHEISGTRPGNYDLKFFRQAQGVVKELHERRRFDVIVPVDLAGMFVLDCRFDVPVVPLIHGTLTSEVPLDRRYWAHLPKGERVRMLWRYKSRIALVPFFRRMLRQAPAVIVDSEFTQRELEWAAGHDKCSHNVYTKCLVVPLGIDLRRYAHVQQGREDAAGAGEAGALRICLLGRLQRIKGVEIAIRAADQLRLRGADFQMSIGGSGEFERDARDLITRRNLNDHVHLVGRVLPEELADFFSRHDVFLFPDLTQPAFGLVAVEAMGHGLPVIGARSGAIPEVLTPETGWLYDPWDVGGLSKLLLDIGADRAAISAKSAAALKRSRFFDSVRMAQDMEKALQKVCGDFAAGLNPVCDG